MAALRCDICGGSLMMDTSGEFASCESCGMKHDKRRMQQKAQEITGTVKIEGTVQVDGINSADKLSTDAETYIKFGNIGAAMDTFEKLSKEHPSDYRGWWGLAKLGMNEISSNHSHRMWVIENTRRAISLASALEKDDMKNALTAYANASYENRNWLLDKETRVLKQLDQTINELTMQSERIREGIDADKRLENKITMIAGVPIFIVWLIIIIAYFADGGGVFLGIIVMFVFGFIGYFVLGIILAIVTTALSRKPPEFNEKNLDNINKQKEKSICERNDYKRYVENSISEINAFKAEADRILAL